MNENLISALKADLKAGEDEQATSQATSEVIPEI